MTTKITAVREQFSLAPIRPGDALIVSLLFLTLIGASAGLARLFLGLEASTALTDTYPWGIWIGFDFSLIAFAGAGFTMAGVVHVLHLHRFQPVLRPAILAGLMGYVAVLLLLVLDLGRPDRFYHFLLFWNLHSPLFEISWCVLLYTTVLVIETSPDFLERLKWGWPVRLVYRIMTPVTIVGVTLSSLHQSTLGTLYLNMPHRLHELWYTPLLPLLFFTSSIMAGLSLGALVYRVAVRIHGRAERSDIVHGLGKGTAAVALVYLLLKLGDLWVAGKLPALLALDEMGMLLAAELGLGVILPIVLWSIPSLRVQRWVGWGAPLLVLLGVGMNRFNATIYAQSVRTEAIYIPHYMEWLSTIGILAGAALLWYLAVRFVIPFDDRGSAHH